MKNNLFSQNEKPAVMQTSANGGTTQTAICPDEVARKAYFAYVNEGSPQGRDVQHWLDAEARLTQERKATRTHQFPNRK